MTAISFRQAQPSDVVEVVPLILSSGPTAFAYVFSSHHKTAEDFLSYAFQSPGGEFSFDNHIVLLKDDEVIGTGAVFSGERADTFTKNDALKILGFYGWRSLPIIRKGLNIERIIRLPKKDEICLGHIGVHHKWQGRGYGQMLMEHLMEVGNKNPEHSFILDVSVENPRAQALYERMDFMTTRRNASSLKSIYGYVADHNRMEKK